MSAKLNIEELLGCLQEAAIVVKGIAEKQHINNISHYFNEDGTPKIQKFHINGQDIEIPLFILADHSSMGLETLEFNFSTRLLSDAGAPPSDLKKGMLGIFKRKSRKGKYNHNVGNLTVDSAASTSWFGRENKNGMAKIKVVFKKDDKPEAVSRLVDHLIQQMNFNTQGEVGE